METATLSGLLFISILINVFLALWNSALIKEKEQIYDEYYKSRMNEIDLEDELKKERERYSHLTELAVDQTELLNDVNGVSKPSKN